MSKLRVYLDNCCYNRPYDDQNNMLIYLETEAKLFIQDLIIQKKLELVWSFVMDYENKFNPYEEKRLNIRTWKNRSIIDCDLCDIITNEARKLMSIGLRQKDASHIACAKYANTDYFITTDKKILNKPVEGIKLINPMDFVRRYLDE